MTTFQKRYPIEFDDLKTSLGNIGENKLFVKFKDYGFFVPTTGLEGKSTIVNGKLSVDTLSVETLRHYAEDGGKSQKEILAITEPQITLSLLADGVIIE